MQIIVPYRDRLEHLKKFSEHYKGFDILVVEQVPGKPFNRGKLFNIGYCEGAPVNNLCFHDVDLLAHDLSIYKTHAPLSGAIHLSGLCEQFGYKKVYEKCFGGVVLISEGDFIDANGFPNNFWGWGGEDDALRERCKLAGIPTIFEWHKYYSQPHAPNGSKHPHYQQNVQQLNDVAKNWQTDGLHNVEYSVIKEYELFGCKTILVDL